MLRPWLLAFSLPIFAQEPRAVLERVIEAVGIPAAGNRILHTRDIDEVEQNYQSAPPFLTVFNAHESWFDPKSGAERISTETHFPGAPPANRGTTLNTRDGIYALRDSGLVRSPGVPGSGRRLNLWAVLADWRGSSDLRLGPEAAFQGYRRMVLLHRGEFGDERLFIDPKTNLPVKLDREEPHYLWGQVHVEYEYLLWTTVDGAQVPKAAARVVDGFKEVSRTLGAIEFQDASAAPSLVVPDLPAPPGDATPLFLQPIGVKRVEAGANTFLSVNPGYTEAVTLVGDTVYVFDATQGESRARQDLELIETWFGHRKVVVVVTDIAWPHIAGVRFWVAQGATIVSHRESKELLTRVVERRWTRAPDLLEQRRKSARFNFVAVDGSLDLEGGKLRLVAIDGIGSEGALMGWVPGDRFLWASDYIQSVERPASYTTEVCMAVKRAGVAPERVAAEHIPLTEWKVIEGLCR